MSHLFLSPHLDDGVLSCGGTIHHLVAAGEAVNVRTVMAGTPSRLPNTAFVKELHARWQANDNTVQARIREDEAAVRHLGATATHMVNWFDCIYRMSREGQALYPDEASIFGEINPHDKVAELIPTIVLAVRDMPDSIFAPLGIGHHVDHQIVRNWGITLKQYYPWLALKFYEEYPYTEDPQAVDKALSLIQEAHPTLQLKREIVPLDEADIQGKLDAIACYKSQISTFWPDLQHMESDTRRALLAAGDGILAERYWVVA